MTEKHLTLEDIRKAVQLIGETPKTRVDYEWGWVEFKGFTPCTIGFNEEFHEEFKKLGMETNRLFDKGEIVSFMGVPVILTKLGKKEEEDLK